MPPPKKILVAPLNWGLGHAARCIPLIGELHRQGASVVIASDGRALHLLRKEFPQTPFFYLPSYRITYRFKNMAANIAIKMPRLLLAIAQENRCIRQIIQTHGIGGIISDNRLGCFSKKIPSVYLTHQINLLAANPLFQWAARHIHLFFIKKYSECWVPDMEAPPNLSGVLSHNHKAGPVQYIGALSRMEKMQVEKKYDVIAVLSGPEPQRSHFEEAVIKQLRTLPYRCLIVQGKTEMEKRHPVGNNIEVVSNLTGRALNEAILAARLFIGRAGYSSMMDLAKLEQPALLVPTPGQTEQEYLGRLLMQNGHFYIQPQNQLDLKNGIPAAIEKGGMDGFCFDRKKMERAVAGFLARCEK
ncbi:MAG TPA: glycosyltransferase [Bacteroidetes bacterium]|nr:glycosyltransferase [Bacteroidota bacterium]